MAVRQWDLEVREPVRTARPALRVVPAPPRRGRPVAAALFVALLGGLIGLPATRAALKEPPAPEAWSHRPLSAAQIPGLDGVGPILGSGIPTSGEPAGGIVFVRCTRLWAALPDGSHERRILGMTGISSPTFAPDGRTIAFFAPHGDDLAIWMVGADGSQARPIADLTSEGRSIAAHATNLTWAPSGGRLAFALTDPSYDAWSGGSTIWSFVLATGEFRKEADGWPAPFWLRNRIAYAQWSGDDRETFWSVGANGRHHRRETRLDSKDADLTATTARYMFSDGWSYRRSVVALRRVDGDVVVAVKANEWYRGTKEEHSAPSPYRIVDRSRVALSQETSRAVVDLVDPHGDRALGLLDLRNGEWTVIEYAWDGATTPAPTSSGPVGARRASRFAGDLMNNWRDDKVTALLVADHDEDLLPFRPRGHILGTPQRIDEGWSVPAVAYGRSGKRSWAYRELSIAIVRTADGRLEARPAAAGETAPIATFDDARAFLADMLGEKFKWPAFLPAGAELNLRWPVSAYSYGRTTQASVSFNVPDGDGPPETFSLAYGDVDFSLGCGGEVDPEDGKVGDEPAVYDHTSYHYFPKRGSEKVVVRTDQVVWPATIQDRSAAFYSVYGDLGKDTITRIAASMS